MMNAVNQHGYVPSEQELFAIGLQDTAYVKRAILDGQVFWAIHSADGQQIGAAPTREMAFAAIRQHDLEPVSVH